MRDLFLGIDLGTSHLKLQVMDERAAPVAEASMPISTSALHPGWAEQDPAQWWEALVAACRQLFSGGKIEADSIAAIGVTGQMHGAVFLDSGGDALRDCLIWADARAVEQVERIGETLPTGDLIRITGNAPNTGFTAPKVLWVQQHEPDIYARTRWILLPKDYLRYRLTGTIATDVTDASATLMFDLARRDWSPDLLRAMGIERGLLPDVHESSEIVGAVSPAAARLTGLPDGRPVVAGGGDAECAALGLGITGSRSDLGVMLSNIGTAAQVFAVTDGPVVDLQGRVHSLCHVTPNRWHVMGAILSGGLALSWLLDVLTPPGGEPPDYDTIAAEASLVAPGSDGLIFLPYLLGERTPHMDPQATAGFFGLRLHHTRAHMARAVMEGVAFALRDGLEVMRELGIAPTEACLAGGGAGDPAMARNPAGRLQCARAAERSRPR